jgi:hypothetical protein
MLVASRPQLVVEAGGDHGGVPGLAPVGHPGAAKALGEELGAQADELGRRAGHLGEFMVQLAALVLTAGCWKCDIGSHAVEVYEGMDVKRGEVAAPPAWRVPLGIGIVQGRLTCRSL